MRRIIVVAASIVVVVGIAATAAAQTTSRFSDVPAGHDAYEAIHWAADVGLTAGWPDGTFRPEQPLHRSHAIVFIDRFYEQVLQATESDNFTRGDMMTLLHTIATAIPAATTTTTAPHPRDANHPNLRAATNATVAAHPEMAGLLGEIRFRESTPTDRRCGRGLWFIRDNCLHTDGGWWIIYNSNWDDAAASHRFVFHIGMALYSTVQTLISAMEAEGISTNYWPALTELLGPVASDCGRVGPHACQLDSNFYPYAYAGEAFAASVLAPSHGLTETTASKALVAWLIDVITEAPCTEATHETDGQEVTFRCTQRRN